MPDTVFGGRIILLGNNSLEQISDTLKEYSLM